jgi:hypothetical protein
MFCKKLCSPKYLIGIVLAIMAIVAFNLGQPGIETDTAAAFNKWYQSTAPKLSASGDLSESAVTLRIAVTARGPNSGDMPTVWQLPRSSLRDAQERENTSRVLQLIRESGVFGFTPLRNTSGAAYFITFSIKDDLDNFEITVPYRTVEGNIQLQNLLKLLDVYSSQTGTPHVEPARL